MNNAYDADATTVRIALADDRIEVADNGTGMDLAGLKQYFNIGEDGPECFTEGNVIYINLDHPLYKRQLRSLDAHTMHLARLMAQEIAIMKDPKDARGAFAGQSQLLRDVFREYTGIGSRDRRQA